MRRIVILLLLALPLSAIDRQPNAEYRARREKLAAKLNQNAALLLFANTEEEGQNAGGRFGQDHDFYYLTGWNEPGAAVLITPKTDTRAYTEILFLPAQNVSQERWTGPKLTAANPQAGQITGFDRVLPLDEVRNELVRILPSPRVTVYTERGNTTPIDWLRRANAFPNYVTFTDSGATIAELRRIKDAGEIALLRKAADATVRAHRAALAAMRPGKNENDIAGVIEFEYRRHGCEGSGFPSIVASGINSTVLHYGDNDTQIADGDIVVMDIGASCSLYVSDVTRTIPANGKFTPRQREIYDIVLAAQDAAVKAFQSGKSTIGRDAENSLYKVAYDYINTHGKDAKGQPLGQYFIHGLSHYVGLAVHDAGSGTTPLQPGAVFTIEPGIYIPEEKIGVRIEDTYLVREDGTLDCLSCGAPKNAAEIEKLMAVRR
jgi:Xaa-Pro aminopeptidase